MASLVKEFDGPITFDFVDVFYRVGVEAQKTADDRVAIKVPIPGSQECAIVGEDLNGKRVAIRIPQKVFLAVADALCKGK